MITPYINVEEAQSYFNDKLFTSSWDNAPLEDKQKSLTHATLLINKLKFKGRKTEDTQANEFPRTIYTKDKSLLDIGIPIEIKYATAELALSLLSGIDPNKEIQSSNVLSRRFDKVQTTYDRKIIFAHIMSGIVSVEAWQYLLPFLINPLELDIKRTG